MSRNKRHVVKRIIAPAQVPVDERPPVPTEQERWDAALVKRAAKDERRSVIKTAQTAREAAEARSRRELRKVAKKEAKAAAAEQAEAVRQAEAELRQEASP